jgi:cytochrome c-type biogenesis protein
MGNLALTSFTLGVLASGSPCVLPLYPGFLAYLCGQTELGRGKRRYVLGMCVLAGVLTMMLLLGAIIAALEAPIGRSLAYVTPLSDGVILVMGILLLADRNPFALLPTVPVRRLRDPLVNAYGYGLLYGPLTLPCSAPLAVAVFTLSLTTGEAVNTFLTFVWFGIGLGTPLLALSVLSGVLQRQLMALFTRYRRRVSMGGGVLLVGIAAYDIVQNWAALRLFYR